MELIRLEDFMKYLLIIMICVFVDAGRINAEEVWIHTKYSETVGIIKLHSDSNVELHFIYRASKDDRFCGDVVTGKYMWENDTLYISTNEFLKNKFYRRNDSLIADFKFNNSWMASARFVKSTSFKVNRHLKALDSVRPKKQFLL